MIPACLTPRLILRPLVAGDAQGIAKALAEEDLRRWLIDVPRDYILADAERFVGRVADDPHTLAVTRNGALIGVIRHDDAQGLGFWLARSHWGRGYMSEALGPLLDRVFSGGATRISADVLPTNEAARLVLMRMGFRPGGLQQVASVRDSAPVSIRRMWLSAADRAFVQHPELRTARLRLAPIRPEDACDIAALASDLRVSSMTGSIPYPLSPAQALAWMGDARWSGRPAFRWGIREGSGRFVGMVMLTGTPVGAGYWIGPDFWGRGYASEAMGALLEDMMPRLGLDEVFGDVFADNPGSHRVLEKLGFEKIGEGSGRSVARLEPAPVFHYRLVARNCGVDL